MNDKKNVLIVYASTYGQTEKIAGYMAGRLRGRGGAVTTSPAINAAHLGPISTFDAVALGGSLYASRLPASLRRFIVEYLAELTLHPRATFFSVSASASRLEGRRPVERICSRYLSSAGWRPAAVEHFGGAVKFPRYGLLTRWIMRSISRRAGGGTDTRREYEYTNWDTVDAFVDAWLG